MWKDTIVEEVRRVRDAYAARFNYDIHAMFEDLRKREEQSRREGRQFVEPAEIERRKADQPRR